MMLLMVVYCAVCTVAYALNTCSEVFIGLLTFDLEFLCTGNKSIVLTGKEEGCICEYKNKWIIKIGILKPNKHWCPTKASDAKDGSDDTLTEDAHL